MANTKGSSGIRNLMYSGKHALLPPKIPFPMVSQAYAEYMPKPTIGSKVVQKPREGNPHHQRTSSESLVIEDQPSWLDDLLSEPETPIRRGGHRRSSSDSFAYVDATNVSNIGYADQDQCGCLSGKDNVAFQRSGLSCPPHEVEGVPSTANESMIQQFAQRSRVRKLQYIAELERNVQGLQAEGSEVSAELEFLNQQNLILSMENKALKQRLESLAQEQLIKYLEQEVLEREIGRLRALYQQQQQPSQQPSASHRRANSRDLETQFATFL
ncbi:Basic-leucine zipper domain [Sesbania bispinosa]|nr:Basic-leucine zipper domain [Sesbania bispinosa]